MKEIVRKNSGDIVLESLEDKQVLVNKSVPFLFQILRKTNRTKQQITITSRGAHLGTYSTDSSYSQ
jgi:hypothetical protein